MKLAVILLLLSGVASLATAINETLCEALGLHRYKEMGLLSITYYHDEHFIFTQPGYRFYKFFTDKITFDSMDLSDASLLDMLEEGTLTEAFSPVRDQTSKGTYMFDVFKFWTLSLSARKRIFLIVTDKGTRSGYYRPDSSTFSEITVSNGPALPDFTLAGIGWDNSKELSGFVISADVNRFPGFITLSQYKVRWDGATITGLPLSAGQTDDRPLFFLQVMDHPYEVFLIHSSNKPDPDAQLLRSVPRSFLFDKNHLVLFDSDNGCVHVIQDFAGFDVDDTKSRTFKRSNYPFEVFFKCGKPIDNPNPNRCNVVKGSHRPTDVTPENLTPSMENADAFRMGSTKTVCLVVVALLAVGLIGAFWIMKKGKGTKAKRAPKPLASSYAVSGTSKRTSKSTFASTSTISPGAKSKFSQKVVGKPLASSYAVSGTSKRTSQSTFGNTMRTSRSTFANSSAKNRKRSITPTPK